MSMGPSPQSVPPEGNSGLDGPEAQPVGPAPPAPDAHDFFDRAAPTDYLSEWAKRLAQPEHEVERDLRSVVIFRLNTEVLAVDTSNLVEVTDLHPVHSIPHRSNDVLLGLVNIRGQLRLCVSLHGLLGAGPLGADLSMTPKPSGRDGSQKNVTYARMVVLTHRNDQWVFPADEVLGVHRFSVSAFRKVPSTYQQMNSHTQAVFDWSGHTVGHLDADRLATALGSHCQ